MNYEMKFSIDKFTSVKRTLASEITLYIYYLELYSQTTRSSLQSLIKNPRQILVLPKNMIVKIYGGFQNSDTEGNIRLTTNGTLTDLALHNVILVSGMKILISDDELETLGIVKFSDEENIWVAEIDRDKIEYLDE